MNPCKFHGSTSLGTFGVICWELDGTVRRWMARVHESSQMNDAKSKYLRRTVIDARYWPTVTYTKLGPKSCPAVAFHSGEAFTPWSFDIDMGQIAQKPWQPWAKGPGKSRLRWSWMRWLSLRGWHWWLQWWADRLRQWEDLGISGAWESSALGGENRKHHEPLFKDMQFVDVCGWKLSFWVFHIHGVVPELTCYIDNRNRQMIASKLLQPTTSSTPLWQLKQAAKKWLRCKFGQKGAWEPRNLLARSGIRTLLFITVCRVCPPKIGWCLQFLSACPS